MHYSNRLENKDEKADAEQLESVVNALEVGLYKFCERFAYKGATKEERYLKLLCVVDDCASVLEEARQRINDYLENQED